MLKSIVALNNDYYSSFYSTGLFWTFLFHSSMKSILWYVDWAEVDEAWVYFVKAS